MRGILAIGLACLLSFTAPAFSADLAMPVKAPPLEAPPPPEFDGLWIVPVVIGIGVCIALCPDHHHQGPSSPGADDGA